ncbi:MFS transporter [Rhizobium daejeonense]
MNDIPLRSPASRNSVLAAVCLAALTLPLSFSADAVATPAIGLDLGGSPESLTWITNAFMLAFGSLLMAAGALADRHGRRRIFLIGLGLFVGFSLALGLAPSIWLIDILRAGQGRAWARARALPPHSPAARRCWRRNSTAMREREPSGCWERPSASASLPVRS